MAAARVRLWLKPAWQKYQSKSRFTGSAQDRPTFAGASPQAVSELPTGCSQIPQFITACFCTTIAEPFWGNGHNLYPYG